MLYNEILSAKKNNQKLLAILLDPDKIELDNVALLIDKINQSPATHIFVGGSHVEVNIIDELILLLKERTELPIVLFPGILRRFRKKLMRFCFWLCFPGEILIIWLSTKWTRCLFWRKTELEVISTGYILIESGTQTAVERVSKTEPLDRKH